MDAVGSESFETVACALVWISQRRVFDCPVSGYQPGLGMGGELLLPPEPNPPLLGRRTPRRPLGTLADSAGPLPATLVAR